MQWGKEVSFAVCGQDVPIIEGKKMAASNPAAHHVVNTNTQDGRYRRIDSATSLYSHYVTATQNINLLIVSILKTRHFSRERAILSFRIERTFSDSFPDII